MNVTVKYASMVRVKTLSLDTNAHVQPVGRDATVLMTSMSAILKTYVTMERVAI